MLPVEFVNTMRKQLGDQADSLCAALNGPSVTSIRLNDKLDVLTFPCDVEEVPWHEDGYYLTERPPFTLDPFFHAGCYYVQEASSMFIEQILQQYVSRDSIVLDLCAAPGGKSTLISQYLGGEGLLISNEVVRQRVFVLSENIQKWGNGNVLVTHNTAEDFGERTKGLFDCMLIDAPCSGEGMFRKDMDARKEWSVRNVIMCAERQRSIVLEAWDALKPGGVLIYSTCTFNAEENEKNAQWIVESLGAEVLPVKIDPSWGIVPGSLGYHFYPHLTKGEGFYVCVFRKVEGEVLSFRVRADKHAKQNAHVDFEQDIRQWLQHPDNWAIRQSDRFMIAYPARHKALIDNLSSLLTCVCTGFGLAELRGKGVAPQHSLSMAKDLRKDAFPNVNLTLEQALSYLRTEALTIEGQPFGTLLLTYGGVALGFAKNVGNRCNNLYPNEWRIRKL